MRLVVPFLLFAALAMGGCGSDEGGGKHGKHGKKGKWGGKRPDPVTVVETAAVAKGTVADVLASSAVVESEAAADIIPVTTGIVLSVHHDEGDPVKKGDVLAVIDNVSLGAGAQRALADVKRLKKQVSEAERLRANGAVSERELEDLRHELAMARTSNVEARRTYKQTRLTAPFDGVVARRDVRVGELASSAAAAFQVVDLERLRVVASLPERDVRRVEAGQLATLVSAYDSEVSAKGSVDRVAPVIDASSGTFRVTIGLDADQQALRPGQFVSVNLVVDQHDDVMVVPKSAVVFEDGAPLVFKMVPAPDKKKDEKTASADKASSMWDKLPELPEFKWPFGEEEKKDEGDGKKDDGPKYVAKRAPVKLGLVDAEQAEILSGIEEGEIIITVGQSNLRDGARVRTAKPAGDEASDEQAEREADSTAGDHG